MLDIKTIRENPQKVKAAMRARNCEMNAQIDKLLEIDAERRVLLSQMEAMKAEQNLASKEIPQLKSAGEDTSAIMEKMKTLSNCIADLNTKIGLLEADQREILLGIPNVPSETVPVGKNDAENVEVKRWGEVKKFNFSPKAHWDLGKSLDILDSERAAKVTGSRFHFYKGLGARLERALISFYLDAHTSRGYDEVLPPFIVNRDSMIGTGQLPKFEEDAFKIQNSEYFLVPTAEVPVTNLYRDEILSGDALPIKHCAFSACFRAEAGSAGRDTRGLIRQHEFNKVELVKFCKPEESYEELESLLNDAEYVLQQLGLPYRVVSLCTGDLGFCSAKTYDVEVWMPSYDRYLEISSCSNFEDYQARRMSIRYKDDAKDRAKLVHTLNGSGVAIGRTVAAILENYQNEDGSVTIPEVLRPYMRVDKIQ